MPREPRAFEPGVVYHLISRFIEREFFVTKQLQREFYLQLTGKALERTDWRLLSYTIMGNHLHHAALAGEEPLHEWLRPVHSPFADSINKTQKRIGPVFCRGPKAFRVPNERVAYLLAYIHNNAVRAGVVGSAIESSWSSHQAYVGVVDAPRWLDVERGLALSGLRRDEFDAWVNDPVQRADRSFSEEAHERELMAANDDLSTEDPSNVCTTDLVAATIVESVSVALGVPCEVVRGRSRGPVEVTARAAAVHCSRLLGLPDRRIAGALNMSQQRVSIIRRQEPSNDVFDIACEAHQRVVIVMRAIGARS